jgi:NADPH-dependent ferric siderophore reductase
MPPADPVAAEAQAEAEAEAEANSVTAASEQSLPELEELIEHFNANHADTVLFLVRHAVARGDAGDAEVVRVDRLGIDFDIVAGGASDTARLEFPEPASTATEVHERVLRAVAEARAGVGNRVPLTSLEEELASTRSLPTFVSHVAQITDRSPNLREIVLEGGLDGFVSSSGDQFVYLMVRRDGCAEVPADHTLAAQLDADAETGPIAAYYTVRSWDASARRMTLWMVRHGGRTGVGGWAGRCKIGERVALWGPRHGFQMRRDASSYLFIADESGLGAVAALLDELPADTPAHVFLETVDPDHVIDLPARERVTVTWLYRHGDQPGRGTRLLDAVRTLDLATDNAAGLVAFGAGEARQMTRTRKYLRHEIGMRKSDVSMTGYWRHDR